MEYELWDVPSSTLIFSTTESVKMVEVLQLLFDENRLTTALDDLYLAVYSASDETRIYEGIEEIEAWLSQNE